MRPQVGYMSPLRPGRSEILMTKLRHRRISERIADACSRFLVVPGLIVVGFLAIAVLVDQLDNRAGPPGTWGPVRTFLGQYAGDTQAAVGLLSAVAGSLFTVASVTFSILLLAVQQGAAALTSQVVDHYLRRTANKVYFGFFTGTSLFVLVTLVQTTHTPHPVFGVAASTLCAAASLVTLLLLVRSTIEQMRPSSLVDVIREATIAARARQAPWLVRTSAPTGAEGDLGTPVTSGLDGYLARVRIDEAEAAVAPWPDSRLVIAVAVGDHVVAGDVLARVVGTAPDGAMVAAVRRALPVERSRDVRVDAAWGVDHLGNVGWTAVSSVKSDPAVAALACDALSELLGRWSTDASGLPRPVGSPVVYPDRVLAQVVDQFEDLVVASSESHQHQSLALVAATLARRLDALAEVEGASVARLSRTIVAALPDHLPTRALMTGLGALVAALERNGFDQAARALADARRSLQARGNIVPEP